MKVCFLITTRGNIAKTRSIREHLVIGLGKAELYFIVAGGMDYPIQGESRRITIINEGTLEGTYKSAGIIAMEVGVIFEEIDPDMVVIVGDRFECLPVAMIAAYMNVPIAHIEGGEVSGSIDESVRHAITKLSHLHFPCTEGAEKKIIQFGENPANVFNFGSTSIDMLRRHENQGSLFKEPYIVVTYHPVSSRIEDLECVIDAVADFKCVWIAPNIDTNANLINKRIHVVKSYPPEAYAPLIKNATCVVGNSSSGIRDTPYFGTPSVNIGVRQKGREKSPSVLDVPVDRDEIRNAIDRQIEHGRYEPSYIYGNGYAGEKIADKILTHKVDIQKEFYDLGNCTCQSGECRSEGQEHSAVGGETPISMGF